jgi:hypothetical protein
MTSPNPKRSSVTVRKIAPREGRRSFVMAGEPPLSIPRVVGRGRRPRGSLWALREPHPLCEHEEARLVDLAEDGVDRREPRPFVAHDTLAASGFDRAHLELRLDERDELAAARVHRAIGAEKLSEADERGVDDREVDRATDGGFGERACVRALENDDARVDAKLVGELPVPDVYGDDALCAALKQAVREASGGGADIQAPDRAPRGERRRARPRASPAPRDVPVLGRAP